LAKQKVTVSLSGDGGDELFLGYAHYSFFKKILKTRILRHLPLAFASNALSTFNSLKLQRLSKRSLSLANAWAQPDMSHLSMHWLDRYRGNQTPLRKGICNEILPSLFLQNTLSSAAFIDATSYLPNDIMVKVDRAAMAVSLETRAPFLDHRIVEFAFGLPEAYKMNKNVSKRILRDILYKYVPRQLVDRPKQGFSIPLNNWLRLELREWAESLLSSISPNSEIWDKQFIEKLWKNHLSCRFDNTEQLWSILMLQSFLLSKNILK
jgi:asparagine synthase (glutamine-hydrolysing)